MMLLKCSKHAEKLFPLLVFKTCHAEIYHLQFSLVRQITIYRVSSPSATKSQLDFTIVISNMR